MKVSDCWMFQIAFRLTASSAPTTLSVSDSIVHRFLHRAAGSRCGQSTNYDHCHAHRPCRASYGRCILSKSPPLPKYGMMDILSRSIGFLAFSSYLSGSLSPSHSSSLAFPYFVELISPAFRSVRFFQIRSFWTTVRRPRRIMPGLCKMVSVAVTGRWKKMEKRLSPSAESDSLFHCTLGCNAWCHWLSWFLFTSSLSYFFCSRWWSRWSIWGVHPSSWGKRFLQDFQKEWFASATDLFSRFSH